MLQTTALTPGTILDGRYELVKVLGSGAVGTVVHVLDRELDRLSLAIKLLHPHLANDPTTIKRFCAESLLARQLCHQNIVRVYDVVSSGSTHFLTMEYIQGCGLDELLAGSSGRRLPFSEAIFILQQVLTALSVAHEHGIIHRDLKPSNVLVDRAGTVRLADFGLATSINSTNGLTKTGEVIGTPSYMAPEQFTGKCDPLSDLYSFGILAFELLVGAPPFKAESAVGLMQQHLSEPLPVEQLRRAAVPEWFITLCERCCAKTLSERPASARAALAIINQEIPVAPSPVVQRSLVTAVRQRQRSHHLLSPAFRKQILSYWILSVFVALGGVLYENNARLRLARRAFEMQRATEISAAPILTILGYGNVNNFTVDELLQAIKSSSFYDVMLLLDAGVAPDGVDSAGLTTTHLALDSTPRILELLCARGAPLEAPDQNGDTPLLAAIRRGLPDHAERLLACRASLSSTGKDRENAPSLAIAQGDTQMLTKLWQNSPNDLLRVQRALNSAGLNSMHIAAQKRDAPMLALLITLSFDINMRDHVGLTPLMRLVRQPRNSATEMAMKVVLNAHPDLAARDNQGRTVTDHIHEAGTLGWLELPQLGQ